MEPLFREDMEKAQCETPGCKNDHGPVYLKQRCHENAGTQTEYYKGVLTITCKVCESLVAIVAVASEDDLKLLG